MSRPSRARAFTLIELIVVIVIIAVLVAVAAVSYLSVIDNSRKSAINTTAAHVARLIQSSSATRQEPIASLTDICGTDGCTAADPAYAALSEVNATVAPAPDCVDIDTPTAPAQCVDINTVRAVCCDVQISTRKRCVMTEMNRTARVRSARDLGAVVAEARQVRGWTQAELAERAGIERGYLSRIESGASVILLDRLFRLLRRLGVEVTATLPAPPEAAEREH